MSFFDDIPENWTILPGVHVSGISSSKLPRHNIAQVVQLTEVLHKTQYATPELLAKRQLAQARHILQFAHEQSAHYRISLSKVEIGKACDSIGAWRSLPILSRADIQRASESFHSEQLPIDHKVVGQKQTSGSTGQPVTINKTNVTELFHSALELREELWHRRDIMGRHALIRANAKKSSLPSWGTITSSLFQTGPSDSLPFEDILEQLTWLEAKRPNYLATYPSNLRALLNATKNQKITLDNLIEIRTIGETLPPDLRNRCENQWSVKVTDRYSSEEAGNIAIECPDSGLYHVMVENLIVEVLRDDGEPCQPGEVGRIVVTDLHNFATPLIRYEIRDYAEVGEPCPCGRNLPTLTRILGRHRNMLETPEGETRWPLTGFHGFQEVAAVRQYQFIQTELDLIEVTLVTDEPLSAEQTESMELIIRDSMKWKHNLVLANRRELIPTGANGKFEDFVSYV